MDFKANESELEVKYEITKELFENTEDFFVTLSNSKVLRNCLANLGLNTEFIKPIRVIGKDLFYKINNKVFRIRFDQTIEGGVRTNSAPVLTVKERLSKDSLTVRKEVDLSVAYADSELVVPFFEELGATKYFELMKDYYIYPIISSGDIKPIIATYEVKDANGQNKRYYLEIEIEKHGDATLEQRLNALSNISSEIEGIFKLNKPVNVSLSELYQPKDVK